MSKKLLSLPIIGGLACGLSFTVPVVAQQVGGLEEIVVTARKRTETVQDTPVSVRAISQQTIRNFDLNSLEDVAGMSPEFNVGRTSNGSGAQLTMRGIGSTSTSIGIEQSVAVVVDDVYYGQGRIINEGMLDLERVELLKGPQALFFGKNATAGVVSLATANPTEEFEATGRASYEFEADQTVLEGILSGPVTDTVGARLALRYTNMEGGLFENKATAVPYNTTDIATGITTPHTAPAGEEDLPGTEEVLGRFTLTYDPTDRLAMELKISGTVSENENPSWNYVAYNCPGGTSALNPGVPCDEDFDTYQNDYPAEIAQFVPHANSDGSLGNEYESWQVTGTIDYEFEYFTLTSVTNFQYNENTFICDCDFQSDIFNAGTWATEDSTWDAFSEEIRLLSSFNGPFNFMVGALYQKTDRDFEQFIQGFGVENTAAPAQHRYNAMAKEANTDGETISPFFQGIWNVTPTVEVTAGARYTYETKDSEFVHPYVHPAFVAVWRPNETAAEDQTFEAWSPELTINWDVTENVMLYAAYKTAYKSGGFSISGIYSQFGTIDDFVFDEETSEGFEAGIKSTLMDNQLRLNATVYTYEVEDFQVDFFNSTIFGFSTFNAGSAETKGFELEADFAPRAVPGLTLRGALNYNEAEYEDFIAPCWAGQSAAQGCNTTIPGTAAAGQDISGEPTAVSPEWTAALAIDYVTDFDNGMALGFTVQTQYSDDYNPSGFANPFAEVDSYTKVDANVRLMGPGNRWELALIGKNLTDEFIVNSMVDGPSTPLAGTPVGVPADQVGHVAYPKTWALQLTMRY
jgi:outer membrane receptor protein involved in Fe transport